jgi:hypothetical protein
MDTPSDEPIQDPSDSKSFGPEITLYTKHLDAIADVLIGMVMALQEATKKSEEDLFKFEDERCVVEIDGDSRKVKVPNTAYRDWKKKSRRFEHFALSRTLLPRSLLVSLVSQYDAYLGRLLRVVFIKKPEILNGSDKKLSFESLSSFSSIDAAREYILEKEVEGILRSSHADQFKWMERTFDLVLTKGLKSWPSFIELTERRNLFVHTDGIVSSQYISVCRVHGVPIQPEIAEGHRLGVPQAYFKDAHAIMYEIGVKLGHVLWRKLFPDERQKADNHLTSLAYDLIDRAKYSLAIRLLDFACDELKKFSDEGHQLTFLVNRAQAYKWNGDDERCRKIMRSVDWTAKGDQFRLADAVLAEDWNKAAKIMRRIGKDGPVNQTDYRDWPLFRNFRESDQFLATYAEVFGEDFSRTSEVKQLPVPSDEIKEEDGRNGSGEDTP